MRTKEEYYEYTLEKRKIVADPKNTRCTCPNTLCDWHGKCKECVALHRYKNEHIPVCLKPVFRDTLQSLLGIFDLSATEQEGAPREYYQYIKERDREANLTKGDDL